MTSPGCPRSVTTKTTTLPQAKPQIANHDQTKPQPKQNLTKITTTNYKTQNAKPHTTNQTTNHNAQTTKTTNRKQKKHNPETTTTNQIKLNQTTERMSKTKKTKIIQWQ